MIEVPNYKRSENERLFLTTIAGNKIDIKSNPRGMSFYENYGNDGHVRLRWYFSERGRLRNLGTNDSQTLIQITSNGGIRDWQMAVLEDGKTPNEDRQSNFYGPYLEDWGFAKGIFNDIPDYLKDVNFSLFDRIPSNRYEFLVNLGHLLAFNIEKQINEGGYPKVELNYDGQLSIDKMGVFERDMLRQITSITPSFRQVRCGITMNYQKYFPKSS